MKYLWRLRIVLAPIAPRVHNGRELRSCSKQLYLHLLLRYADESFVANNCKTLPLGGTKSCQNTQGWEDPVYDDSEVKCWKPWTKRERVSIIVLVFWNGAEILANWGDHPLTKGDRRVWHSNIAISLSLASLERYMPISLKRDASKCSNSSKVGGYPMRCLPRP